MPVSQLFNGMSSGVPWGQITEAILESEAQPLRRIEQRLAQNQRAESSLDTLAGHVGDVSDAISPLRFMNTMSGMSADVGETSTGVQAFTADAQPGTDEGLYNVEVVALASRETQASGTFASMEDALGMSGELLIGGGTIELDPGDSLSDLRDRINDAEAGAQASVIRVAEGEYRLAVTATETGEQGTGLDASGVQGGLDFTVQAAGADAHIRVDGIDVYRGSNRIDDVIPGVSMDLHQTTAGEEVGLAIGRDVDAIADRLEGFVEAYNELHGFIGDQTVSSEDGQQPDLYRSRTALRGGLRGLRSALGEGLFRIGMSVASDGSLEFNRADFEARFAEDPEGMTTMLNDIGSDAHEAIGRLRDGSSSVIGGARASIESQTSSLESQQGRWESRLERRREALTRQFNSVERMISEMDSAGQSVFSALYPQG